MEFIDYKELIERRISRDFVLDETSSYEARKYDVVAVCDGYNEENKMIEISQKNKFLKGDVLDILQPGEMPFNLEVKEIFDEWGNKVDQAPHAMQKLFIPCSKAIKVGSFFRRKR